MNNLQLALKLVEQYVYIGREAGIKTAKELSKLTYTLRESGLDIPYLAVGTKNAEEESYFPAPTARQKNWKWMKDINLPTDIKTEQGWIKFTIEQTKYGCIIQLDTVSKFTGERVVTNHYSAIL